MADSFDTVESLLKDLADLRPFKAEDEKRLQKKFRLEFNYNSNHIEGNTLTYGETELLLIFDDTIGNHHLREYEETKAHDIAYRLVEDWAKDTERPLTEQAIKNLNEIILVRPYWKDAITPDGQSTRREIKIGNYKEYSNSVRLQNGEMFEYASPVDTPILMRELMDWYRKEERQLHPITLATMLHYKFVRIHPFDDGNGRIARILMNYVLLKNEYPPIIIKSSDKNNYLRVLHIADLGNYEPLISYITEQCIWSLNISVKAAKGESLDETNDFLKEIELLKRKATVERIPYSPKVLYDTFKMVNNQIWLPLLKIVEHFDSLFNESKDVHKVNHFDERYITRYVADLNLGMLGYREISDEPLKLKIYGYDIYEHKIHTVELKHQMYGLKGARFFTSMVLSMKVRFDDMKYSFELALDKDKIFQVEKNYKEKLPDDTVLEINNTVKKNMLEVIKAKTN